MLFRYFSALTASWETFEGLGMACTGLWMGFKFLQQAVCFCKCFWLAFCQSLKILGSLWHDNNFITHIRFSSKSLKGSRLAAWPFLRRSCFLVLPVPVLPYILL